MLQRFLISAKFFQTPQLFSGAIRENQTYENPGASQAEIYRALDLVPARSLVDNLAQRLDTDVGKGGDFLSAGEKQLIFFARSHHCKEDDSG